MIQLDAIATPEFELPALAVGAGETVMVRATSEEQNDLFIDTLLGFRRPEAGRVLLLGEDIYKIEPTHRWRLLAGVGFVRRDGGLINNLKAWENILLAAGYHRGLRAADAEETVEARLRLCGMSDAKIEAFCARLPAFLSLYERRLAGMLRVFLAGAMPCVYDCAFDDIEPDRAENLARLVAAHQSADAGRATLCTACHEITLREIIPSRTIHL
jgi:ABC-type transporter Mla maintaining outer membrane lipid asymmetry ATPase subunit MlaF